MRVVLSSRLPIAAEARRHLDGLEVVEPAAGRFAPDELVGLLREADGLVALLSVRVDEALLRGAPRLRAVGNFAVGHDNVDLAAATARGVAVTNTPDVLTEATADLAFALLLAAARRLREGVELAASGAWQGWEPEQLLGVDVAGGVMGVVGFGRIGQAVARRARGFGMEVLYSQRRPAPPEVERALGASHVPLDELLGRSGFVSLHLPLSASSRHLIGAAELARMRPGAILVNTARGPIVDEAALAAALASGHLGGVGLDVFEEEPRIHPALRAAPRAVLLPHLGSATLRTRERMAELAILGVTEVLRGRRPGHLLNPEALERRRALEAGPGGPGGPPPGGVDG